MIGGSEETPAHARGENKLESRRLPARADVKAVAEQVGMSQTREKRKVSPPRPKLSKKQEKEMLAMLAGLTPVERSTLADPKFITEDEADLIFSDRSIADPAPRISVDEVFAELGIARRKRPK